ncbi:hypothetical protein D3C80_1386440 [compost metagenome]
MLEHRRKGCQQVVDQAADIADERPGTARWQFQRARLAGFVVIVDVHPVGGCLHALALGLEVALDEREAARAGLAHDKNVIARTRHGDAELQGFDCAFLAKHTAKRLQIIGGGKSKLFSGERAGQRFRRKTQAGSDRIGHRASLLQAGQMEAFWRRPCLTCKAQSINAATSL